MPLLLVFLNKHVPEAGNQNCDLKGICSDKEVIADRGPAMRFQEYHQEAEANENHHMYILEKWVVSLNFVRSVQTSCISRKSTWMHSIWVLCEHQIQDDYNDLTDHKDALESSMWVLHRFVEFEI